MKSPAPLLSLNPSGTFAGLITASIWKGRNYIRQRVDPSNPSTAGQVAQRLIFGAIAKAARAVLTSFSDEGQEGSQFFQDARDGAPSGQSWISYLQKHGSDALDTAQSHWEDLDITEQGYFDTEGGVVGLSDYSPVLGGLVQSPILAGQQLMALGFFGSVHLENSICTAAVEDDAPSEGEVQALGSYVHQTTGT